LDAVDIEDRLKITLELLNNEREIVRLQKELSSQVETKINKQHREYMLKEQVKMINKELGVEKDDKEELINKYKSLVAKFRTFVPASTLKVIEDEISKMASLDRNSPEFNVTRSYLDWLTSIPWGTYTKDELNIKKAAVILDEEHYGLEDIKTRILEFIAVGRLKGSVGGKIICFIGPPGVGKK
jgi:Lon-like ATP-dependent protease